MARKKLKDNISFWIAVNKGEITPFIDTTINWEPPDIDKPWAFDFTYPGNSSRWRLSIGYRGCTQLYEYPFRASAFRYFQNNEDTQRFDGLKKFIQNLIVEFIWCINQIALRPIESESIIQHYKILPWTYMTDLTYDINIAKAFACSLEPQRKGRTPVLYKVVLLNVDYYDMGASFLSHLPFQRPKLQNALSLIGLNEIMQDPTGVIVSLTEHPFYYDHKGNSWDSFGGSSFKIHGQKFNSLFLEEKDYQQLQSLLCPQESEEVKDFFSSIIVKVRTTIDYFGLSYSIKQGIFNRLMALEKELNILSKNDS